MLQIIMASVHMQEHAYRLFALDHDAFGCDFIQCQSEILYGM